MFSCLESKVLYLKEKKKRKKIKEKKKKKHLWHNIFLDFRIKISEQKLKVQPIYEQKSL